MSEIFEKSAIFASFASQSDRATEAVVEAIAKCFAKNLFIRIS